MNESESRHLRSVSEYRDTVANLLPVSCRHIVDNWSISRKDHLALVRFLERYPREMVLLEIGTFLGVSAFNFASHPKVSEVVSIDWNPSLAELNESGDLPDPGPSLREVRVLDLAQEALTHFPEQQRKVRLLAGTVESVALPTTSRNASLVAFVDGDHAKESLTLDLKAIFDKNPTAFAILHDCRGSHSPAVLAGIASFLQDSPTENYFRLFEPSSPEIRPPNLGAIYPRTLDEELDQAVSGLLASPKTSLIQAAFAVWRSWNHQRERAIREEERAIRQRDRATEQRERAIRQRKRARRQRKRANRLEVELQKARRPWWRGLRR
jgi:hypothetical protein